VLCGGEPVEGKGAFYMPTVLSGVTQGMPAFDDETFGPVAAITRVPNLDAAVKAANASQFGLSGNLWTKDVELARKIARDLYTGGVFINGVTASDPRVPVVELRTAGTAGSFPTSDCMLFGSATSKVGVTLLDAMVSSSTPQAESAQLVFLVGGDVKSLKGAEPLLKALGSSIQHAGPQGSGALAKLATNTLMGVQLTTLAELVGMLKRQGVDPKQVPTVSVVRNVFKRAIDENLGDLNMTAVVKLFDNIKPNGRWHVENRIRCPCSHIDPFCVFVRFTTFGPLYRKQVQSVWSPLSDQVSWRESIRGSASRSGSTVSCHSSHNSPPDYHYCDHRVFCDPS
jgi:hypothetical protein